MQAAEAVAARAVQAGAASLTALLPAELAAQLPAELRRHARLMLVLHVCPCLLQAPVLHVPIEARYWST